MKGLQPTRPQRSEAEVPGEDCVLNVEAIYRAHAQRVARWAARLGGPTLDVDPIDIERALLGAGCVGEQENEYSEPRQSRCAADH